MYIRYGGWLELAACFSSWQLGLAEKDVVIHDFELALSDPSDAHTNSTIALSDDTDAKLSEGIHPDLNVPSIAEHQEDKVKMVC